MLGHVRKVTQIPVQMETIRNGWGDFWQSFRIRQKSAHELRNDFTAKLTELLKTPSMKICQTVVVEP